MDRDPTTPEPLSFDAFDEQVRPAPQSIDFDRIVAAAMDRRGLLGGALAFGAITGLASGIAPRALAADRFGFAAVAANTDDDVTVPKGYRAEVVVRWGDPILPGGRKFDGDTRGSAATQALAFGDNNDGMAVFEHDGRTLLIVNNEYANRRVLWGNRSDKRPANEDDIAKGKAAHGVSIVEIENGPKGWQVVPDSALNRRITPDTPMRLAGPAAGHPLVQTGADPEGSKPVGTWNNCGSGRTPWGTYLACEENFNGYFSASGGAASIPKPLRRYGIGPKGFGYDWARIDLRFDVSLHPNEANRAGYVVEIDPADPASTPVKRSALGRFKHENAEVVVNQDGRVVVYMGDDERGEFLYRYVSDGVWQTGDPGGDLLDKGTLYAAVFNEDGTGTWKALTVETTGMDAASICIQTRHAASTIGATTMDRPEWVAANPSAPEVYCALTNNTDRGKQPNRGGDDTPVGGPNPRAGNQYGQIVRWRPAGGDHAADGFDWDLYVLAGNPNRHSDARGGSENVTPDNMFNAPDGLAFDTVGRLWIQTDGKYTDKGDFKGMGNNQMLAGDPATGEIRRFLVGPRECEVTGLAWSPDRRTMFVGIQHPGEKGGSHWPEGWWSVPRSAVIAVTRDDGGVIG